MKINLEPGDKLLNGYLNISGSAVKVDELPDNTDYILGKYFDLDPIVENEMAEEIRFNPPINVIPPNNIVQLIEHWKGKLKKGGSLVFSFVDIRRVGRLAYRGNLDLETLDGLVFGPNHQYHGLVDTQVAKNLVEALGFTIDTLSVPDYVGYLTATKD